LARLAQIAPAPELLDAYAEAQLHEARGLVPGVRGRVGALVLGFERAAACYESAVAARDLITTLGSLGWALYCVGQLDAAKNALERGLALAQRTGAPQPRIWVEFQLALVTAELDPARGVELLERSVEQYAMQSSRRQEGWARTELARALLACGDAGAAEAMAARGSELLASGLVFLPRALSVRALALVRLGDGARAREVAMEARRVQDEHSFYIFDGCVRTALVEALGAAGDRSGQASELSAARRALSMRSAELERPEWRESFGRLREHARLAELD
jgi:tetratricopeptide (TPR) repeat protein